MLPDLTTTRYTGVGVTLTEYYIHIRKVVGTPIKY